MNREKFEQLFKGNSIKLSEESRSTLLFEAITRHGDLKNCGFPNETLIIAIEEMSELQKELTKMLRGKGNTVGILEEIADVFICINEIQYLFGISNEDLWSAVDVKLLQTMPDEVKQKYLDLSKGNQ